MNAGQGCVNQTRILAPRSRYDEIVEAVSAFVQALPVGPPSDPATQIGPLISEKQRQRVEGYIAKGIEEGARLVCGGGRPDGLDGGYFVAADGVRRRRQQDDDRAGGDLRAGAVHHPLRHRGGRDPHRQRFRLRPGRQRVDHRRAQGHRDLRRRSAPARTESTGTPSIPAPRSAATRTRASAARTGPRASSTSASSRACCYRWATPSNTRRDPLLRSQSRPTRVALRPRVGRFVTAVLDPSFPMHGAGSSLFSRRDPVTACAGSTPAEIARIPAGLRLPGVHREGHCRSPGSQHPGPSRQRYSHAGAPRGRGPSGLNLVKRSPARSCRRRRPACRSRRVRWSDAP